MSFTIRQGVYHVVSKPKVLDLNLRPNFSTPKKDVFFSSTKEHVPMGGMGFLAEVLEQACTSAPEIVEGTASGSVQFRFHGAVYQLDDTSLSKLDTDNQMSKRLTWTMGPGGMEQVKYHQPGKQPMNMLVLRSSLTSLCQVLRTNLARAEQAPNHAAAMLQSLPLQARHTRDLKFVAFDRQTGRITFQIRNAEKSTWKKIAWHPPVQITVSTEKLEIRNTKGEILTLHKQGHPAPLTYQEAHSSYPFLVKSRDVETAFKQLFINLLIPCWGHMRGQDIQLMAGYLTWAGLPASARVR